VKAAWADGRCIRAIRREFVPRVKWQLACGGHWPHYETYPAHAPHVSGHVRACQLPFAGFEPQKVFLEDAAVVNHARHAPAAHAVAAPGTHLTKVAKPAQAVKDVPDDEGAPTESEHEDPGAGRVVVHDELVRVLQQGRKVSEGKRSYEKWCRTTPTI
jgi:hypothetical protein